MLYTDCVMSLAIIILAAGKGTRMNSDIPKILHNVQGITMIDYTLTLAQKLQAQKTVLVVGFKKELVIERTRRFKVDYVVQEPQSGTGHAVMVTEEALSDFDGEVLVCYGDVPLLSTDTITSLRDMHRGKRAVATILTAELQDPYGYGRIMRDDRGFVQKIVEEGDATGEEKHVQEVNSGIYIFNKQDLFEALKHISNDNAQGEYYLTDVIQVFVTQGKTVAAVKVSNPDEILGINTPEQLERVEGVLGIEK